MFQSNDIIITNNKKDIIKNNNKLKYIKVYSLNEFIKLYYFDYDIRTINYIMDKYKVIYSIALIYLKNLTFIDNKKYKSEKLNFLSELKKEMITNKLLTVNPIFKDYLKNKNIIIYNLPPTKELNKMIRELEKDSNVSIENDLLKEYNNDIYEFNSLEEEVLFVATKITDLIKEGIDINKIYISNIDDAYKKNIKRLFSMYNIPISLESNDYLYGTYLAREFLDKYNGNIEETMEYINNKVDTEEELLIYKEILKIINSSLPFDDNIDSLSKIKYEFQNTKIPKKQEINVVKEKSITENIKDDEYLFLLSFNQGIIPKAYKDEEYLNDKEKEELDISLTKDKNILSRNNTINNIKKIKNLTITYKTSYDGEEYKISNINEELKFVVIDNNKINYNYSNKYNKIYLTSLMDEYSKYGTITNDLLKLNKHYENLPYNTYNHTYKGINKDDLLEYLSNKLTLSYSSLNNYYKCPFSYYIENILKINKYEETFYQNIGTLFHSILEKITYDSFDFEQTWERELKRLNKDFNPKELFFLNKIKKELEFVIDTIKYQETLTNLHDELHEEKIYISSSKNTMVSFKGFIDKIKYKKTNDKTIIAIIDYKTGNTDVDLSLLPYGLNMQLPIYLYLAKRSNKFTNVEIAGFYIQKILNNEISTDNKDNYETEKRKNLLLQGYSNENIEILNELDNTYTDSELIKGLKMKKDGDFYNYSKVLSSSDMYKIETIIEEKIEEGANNILNANFPIAPKKIEKKNYGCSFCKYKDICYRKNEDIEELPKLSAEEVLKRGDDNGLD